MVKLTDIAWAAGFIEGEGTISPKEMKLRANQVSKEPIDKLVSLFGGAVYLQRGRGNHKAYYLWQLTGYKAAAVMMTIYSFMSSRRKRKIEEALEIWKKRRIQFHKGNPYGDNRTVSTTC